MAPILLEAWWALGMLNCLQMATCSTSFQITINKMETEKFQKMQDI
jgi:hypothetical protein